MEEILFKIENGKVYFEKNDRGYGLEECCAIIDGLVVNIKSKTILSSTSQEGIPKNVINYEDILDKRIVKGDNSKSTQKLKQWLDNDPDVISEDGEVIGNEIQ